MPSDQQMTAFDTDSKQTEKTADPRLLERNEELGRQEAVQEEHIKWTGK